MEISKAKNQTVRLFLPKNGDRLCIDISVIDLPFLRGIFNQNFIPLEIYEEKIPIKKYLPFIKKKYKYLVYEFKDCKG